MVVFVLTWASGPIVSCGLAELFALTFVSEYLVGVTSSAMKICRGEIIQYALVGLLVFLPLVANMTIHTNSRTWQNDLLVFGGLWAILVAAMVFLRVSRWWLTPLVLGSLVYSCFVWVTGYDIGYHAISAMYETNGVEALEFVKSPIIVSGLIAMVILLVTSLYCLHCKLEWKLFAKPVLISQIWLIALALVGGVCLTTWKVLGNDFTEIYPAKFICQSVDYYSEVYLLRGEYEKLEYVYEGPPVDEKPETYIFVMGESARTMNWDLYGYDRSTTPIVRKWLSQYSRNSALFTKPIASGRVTRVSVPMIFSVANSKDYPQFYKSPSFIRVFREAGYKTFVASAQTATGYYEGLPNMVLNDAEVVVHLQDQGIWYPLDEQLLPLLDKYLQDPAPKKLIILHLQGSHLEYAERYPETFDTFHGRGEQIDSYDNSILYTDWMIGQIFERAKSLNFPAFVFYASDHGENLNDEGDGNFSHGVGEINKYEINIPMVCYFNEHFGRTKPRAVELVREHKNRLITHDMVSHTFMGLAGLDATSVYKPTYDLASPKFAPGELYFADSMRTILPLSQLQESIGSGIAPISADLPKPVKRP